MILPTDMARAVRFRLELAEKAAAELLKGWPLLRDGRGERVKELGDFLRRNLHRSKDAVEAPSESFFSSTEIPSPVMSVLLREIGSSSSGWPLAGTGKTEWMACSMARVTRQRTLTSSEWIRPTE
jgi:hypothetical protein